MYLLAISLGYAVPYGNFDARVHSVFQSAVNLSLGWERGLLTLITADEGDLPQGIRLDMSPSLTFGKFQPGEPALCRDNILQFVNSQLTVQLEGAKLWKCDLTAFRADPANPAVSAAWIVVWDILNKRQMLSGSEIIARELLHFDGSVKRVVTRKAGEGMHSLVNAARQIGLADPSTINSLIGLGSGLTPAGDDLLVGYLTGLWCSVGDRSERTKFVSDMGKAVILGSKRTNDISRTYLFHAAQGQVSSLLANLAEGICVGRNPDFLHDAAEKAMRVGHTSGMDTVTGLLIGLAAWDGNHLLSE